MKYIRTNDGVYEVKEDFLGFYVVVFEKVLTKAISKEYVLKESDNIEELCDRVFAFHKEDKWGIPDLEGYYLDGLKEEIIREHKKPIDDFIFKLAIWTDKGLTYVAESNDKGDLKLL